MLNQTKIFENQFVTKLGNFVDLKEVPKFLCLRGYSMEYEIGQISWELPLFTWILINSRNSAYVCISREWWVSELIPRFTKIFEYSKNFEVIVFGIKNNALIKNLSPWARSRAAKSDQTFWKYGLGKVPFKIKIFKKQWNHRNQRSKEQWLFNFHAKIIADSSVFRSLKFRVFQNRKP